MAGDTDKPGGATGAGRPDQSKAGVPGEVRLADSAGDAQLGTTRHDSISRRFLIGTHSTIMLGNSIYTGALHECRT